MKVLTNNSKHHVFVCCRTREGKPSCGGRGSEDLVKQLKDWVQKEDLKDQVRIAQSSCLGHCKDGIALCIYPQNQWLTHVDLTDLKNIQDRVLETISLQKL